MGSAKQKENHDILRNLETSQANNAVHIEDCWREVRRLQKYQFDALAQLEDHTSDFMSSSSTRPSSTRQSRRENMKDDWLSKKGFVASLEEQKCWENRGSAGHSSFIQDK